MSSERDGSRCGGDADAVKKGETILLMQDGMKWIMGPGCRERHPSSHVTGTSVAVAARGEWGRRPALHLLASYETSSRRHLGKGYKHAWVLISGIYVSMKDVSDVPGCRRFEKEKQTRFEDPLSPPFALSPLCLPPFSHEESKSDGQVIATAS
jgi:hypothetical protein